MSDSAKNLDLEPEIIIDEDSLLEEIDLDLYGSPFPEQTSIHLKIPKARESDLIQQMIDEARIWANDTLITHKSSEEDLTGMWDQAQIVIEEPIQEIHPAIHSFKVNVYNAIAATYLAPAWDYLQCPPNEDHVTHIEQIQTHAIRYVDKLANYNYQNYIRLECVKLLTHLLTSADWHSKSGLEKIDKRIRSILQIQAK